MARFLRQSTAATLRVGPFVSPADGFTAATAVTGTPKLSKNGGTLANATNALGAHDADGYYPLSLAAGDVDTVGRLRIELPGASGYTPAWEDFVVLSAAVFDVWFGSTAPSTYAGGAVASVTGSVGSVAAAVTLSAADSPVKRTGTAQAGAAGSITLDAGAGGTDGLYLGDTVAVLSGTGAGQTRQIVSYVGSTKVAGVHRNWAVAPDNTSVFAVYKPVAPLLDSAGAVYQSVGTGAGQINLSGGKAPATLAATDVAGNVPADLQTIKAQAVTAAGAVTFPGSIGTSTYAGGNVTVGGYAAGQDPATLILATAGNKLATDASGRVLLQPTQTGVTIPTVTAVANAVVLPSIPANWVTSAGIAAAALNGKGDWNTAAPPTAAAVAAQVWSEALPGSYTSGQAGNKLNAAGSAGDPWSTSLPGGYGAGTAGNIIGNRLDVGVSTRLATSGYTAPDNPSVASALSGTSTLLSRVPAAVALAGTAPSWYSGGGGGGLTAQQVRDAMTLAPSAGTPAAGSVDAQIAALPASAADKLLGRSIAGGADGGRTVGRALAGSANKVAFDTPSAGQYTVYAADDTTPLYTGAYTRDSQGRLVVLDPT